MARPTVKTDAILDAIVGHLFAGLSFDTISGLVGVSESAIYKWRKADEDFDARCQEAMRKWEQGKLAVIEEAVYSKDGPKWPWSSCVCASHSSTATWART
jgi:transposase